MNKDQLVICQSHSLRLLNATIKELNEAKKESTSEELINYLQKEIDDIWIHLESIGYKG
jgi:hypothetical protein